MVEIIFPMGKLRRITNTDFDKLVEISQDKPVLDFYFIAQDVSAVEEYWINAFAREQGARYLIGPKTPDRNLVIESDRQICGCLGYWEFDLGFELKGNTRGLCYFVGREFRGRGLATNAIKSFIEYSFATREAIRIQALCNSDNYASLKALERAGLYRENSNTRIRSVTSSRNGIKLGLNFSDFEKGENNEYFIE